MFIQFDSLWPLCNSSAIMPEIEKIILIIKHGALGDFIQSTGIFKALRQKHINEKIVLLTSSPYGAMARQCKFFDEVWLDDRAKLWQLQQSWRVIKIFRNHAKKYCFKRVYDLQCSGRTNLYFKLLRKPKPEWVGTATGCSHPRAFPKGMYHALENHRRHLQTSVGMRMNLMPDISWLTADISPLRLPKRFIVLIPGCSEKHSEKRWSVTGYATLIEWLWQNKIASVLTGGPTDKTMIEAIKQKLPHQEMIIDLTGMSPMPVMAALSRQAIMVLGSDTGPMHLAAATGCVALVLFSKLGHAAKLCHPVGEHVTILECGSLATLPVQAVIEQLTSINNSIFSAVACVEGEVVE